MSQSQLRPRKVWAISHTGSLANLHYENDLLPPPPPHHVQIKVHCVGLNFADVFAILGVYSATPKEKFIPGFEVSGIIEAVGEHVDKKEWLEKRVYAVMRFGAYSTYVNVKTTYVKQIPQSWTYQEGCAFVAQAMTAFYALEELGGLKPQQTILVHSAAGGVGMSALAILEKKNAKIIGTVGNQLKLDVLNGKYGENPNFTFILRHPAYSFESRARHELNKLGEDGVDIVLDSVMGDWFWPNYNLLRNQGRLILVGAGSFTPTGNLHPFWNIFSWIKLAWAYIWRQKVDAFELITSNKAILGFNLIHLFHKEEVLNQIFEGLASLNLDPPFVGHVFSFEDAPDAIKLIQSGKSVGKVILNVLLFTSYELVIANSQQRPLGKLVKFLVGIVIRCLEDMKLNRM
ncbi:hypothetical protein G9A89_014991 [Geosiphon pyriformis]|nr:hypothetical protein G9A89_014991 [Geosiphon pyriformis]